MVVYGHDVLHRLNKRRKWLIQDSLPWEEPDRFDCLGDDLLLEILCRISSSNYVFLCKCVCKRWAHLLSQPCFVPQFIASKLHSKFERRLMFQEENGTNKIFGCSSGSNTLRLDASGIPTEKGEKSLVFVARNVYCGKSTGLKMHLKDLNVNFHNFSISPLTCLVDRVAISQPVVVGACNDLLLCLTDERDYYISNVQTKQWLLLPSPPFDYGPYPETGFICDPCYSSYNDGDSSCNITVNATYRYSIIVISESKGPASEYKGHMLSSSTKQWSEIVLSLPNMCNDVGVESFGFAGMLHFRCCEGLISFDPYTNPSSSVGPTQIKCRFISWPPEHQFRCMRIVTGESHGCLRVVMLDEVNGFFIWVLKDYVKGTWSLQSKLKLKELVPCDPLLAKQWVKRVRRGTLLGKHPTNPDLIYLLSPRWILLCNINKKTVEVASCLPSNGTKLDLCIDCFQLFLPIWPSPLPVLM